MGKQITILIVEDEDSLRSGLRDVLHANHFSTIEAKNGKEAIEFALSAHPDLILLDLMLPVMGGIEALKKIRQNVWGKNVPAIILTNINATDEQLVEDMVAQSPSFYLIKSDWKIHDIVTKIKKILGITNK